MFRLVKTYVFIKQARRFFSCFCLSNTMADRKAVIKNADMAEDMQQDAIDCATQALEKYLIKLLF